MMRIQMFKMIVVVMMMTIHRPSPESGYRYTLSPENQILEVPCPLTCAIGNYKS